jgi:hypothetical protein
VQKWFNHKPWKAFSIPLVHFLSEMQMGGAKQVQKSVLRSGCFEFKLLLHSLNNPPKLQSHKNIYQLDHDFIILLTRRGDYGKMKRQLNWWTLQLLQAAHFMKFYGAFMWDSCVFKIIPMIGH